MKRKIDYSIIWRSIHDRLTEDEERRLEQWRKEDESHEAYFQKLIENRRNGIIFHFSKEKEDEAWARLNIQSLRQARKSYWGIGIAASIACIVIAATIWFLIPQQIEPVVAEDISFEPGIKKATLVLNDGKKLDLQSKKDTLLVTKDAVIENKDSKLNYRKNKPKAKKIKYNKLMIPRGAEYHLVLSDGTKVWVNSETIIRYPVTFGKKERKVEVLGEAFFDVKTDSLRPFIVSSGNHEVQVFGTEFNVKAYPDEETITTTLVEGKVAVRQKESNESLTFLEPGYQSVFQKVESSVTKKHVDIRKYTSWKDGSFYFRKMPLDEMLTILGRWYDVDFKFKADHLKQIQFNGTVEKRNNIQSILDKLMKTNELTFTAYENTIYVE
ncbi:DUF4974 domain-containing protein [Puteibacter caeruleilacunae]|nr:DUF4974 domain-containing protein [Puteibacter caeruleilacunae]